MSKEEFRTICLKKLRNISKANRLANEKRLLQDLEKLLESLEAKKILFYWPMSSEVNVAPLIQKMRKKHQLYLPFKQDVSFKMVPFRLPLVRKKFGIYETGNSYKTTKIDVVIVPIVGVDANQQRIGFGKGMYDRFFANLPYTPIKIFIQPQLCYTTQHICDDYDIKADYLLTPQGYFTTYKRSQYDKRTAFKRVYCNSWSSNRFCYRVSHRKKNCSFTS